MKKEKTLTELFLEYPYNTIESQEDFRNVVWYKVFAKKKGGVTSHEVSEFIDTMIAFIAEREDHNYFYVSGLQFVGIFSWIEFDFMDQYKSMAMTDLEVQTYDMLNQFRYDNRDAETHIAFGISAEGKKEITAFFRLMMDPVKIATMARFLCAAPGNRLFLQEGSVVNYCLEEADAFEGTEFTSGFVNDNGVIVRANEAQCREFMDKWYTMFPFRKDT